MKPLWLGFKDVWEVVIIDSLRGKSLAVINLFDIGVFLGIASMLAVAFGFAVGVKTVVSWMV